MTLTAARQVADAVLYEGYLLYPYRASSSKNQIRWQFGVLGPDGAALAGDGEEPQLSTEVVLEPREDARLDVFLRFLQVQSRVVERWTGTAWVEADLSPMRFSTSRPRRPARCRSSVLAGLAARLNFPKTVASLPAISIRR